ncbi:MAG: ComEC/Rec2 family competence protein [Sarcina sp.]
MSIAKIEVNKPAIHLLFGLIVGILIYLLENKFSAAFIAVLFILFIFKVYDFKYFKIIISFFLLGYILIFAYFNLVGNRYGIYSVRMEKIYSDYGVGILNGRKVNINYKNLSLKENEIIKFKGKFKREINKETGVVGELFIKEVIEKKEDFIYKIRNIATEYNSYLNKYLKENESAILTALTFGRKEFLEKEVKDNYKELGVIHLICISGFHIALIYGAIKKIFNYKIALVITFCYVGLVGFTASAVRAFIMILMLSLATKVFKNYDSKNALALSAIILLVLNPINLINIGFQLSYLATLGIILNYNFLNRGLYKIKKYLREPIALSLASQLFVYPYMLFIYKSFSMNFLIGSLVLTPLITVLLPIGLILIVFFVFSIDITFIDFIIKYFFLLYDYLVDFLNLIAIPMNYSSFLFIVGYFFMIICFYMDYLKVNSFKFKELGYLLFIGVVIGSFNFSTTFSIYKKDFNKALVVSSGFYKEAFSFSENQYFNEEIKKDFSLTELDFINNQKAIKLEEDFYLFIDKEIENSFILLKDNKYDIIDLLNEEKILYHKGKFIYVNERRR